MATSYPHEAGHYENFSSMNIGFLAENFRGIFKIIGLLTGDRRMAKIRPLRHTAA